MNTQYGDNLFLRNDIYQFLYTVPSSYRDRRGGPRQIVKSLKTRDLSVAKRLAILKKTEMIVKYESHDFHEIKEVAYETCVNTAKRFGLEYITPQQIKEASPQDFVELMSDRVIARESTPRPNVAEVKTFGAAVSIPLLPASKLFLRWKELKPEKVARKSPKAAKTYWRRYELFALLFIESMGDLDMCAITEETVEEFRDALVARIMDGLFLSEYANKAMRYMRSMVKEVFKRDHKGKTNPFANFETIVIDDANKGEPLTEDEVRTIRAKLKTSNLPEEIKAIMTISQNTGAGVTELCLMAPEDVVLTGDIPHLKIRKNKYRAYLKTKDRERELPLIGEALEAMKKFPNGFTDYTNDLGVGRVYSATQRFMKTTVPNKTFRGYRHRIAELMRNSEFKDQWQNAVMGHATPGKTGYYGGPVWLTNTYKVLMEALPEDNR